jgi:MFS family permease
MTLSIIEGMSAQAQTCCTGLGAGGPNAITIGFAFLLGAGPEELGLLAALPVLGSVLQYVAVLLAPRMRARKPLVAITATLGRVAYLPLGLLPFLVARETGLKIFLLGWFVTNALLSLSGNLWTSWMADLVPPGVRGRYFSRRTRATTVVSVLVPLGISYVLDRWFGGVPRGGPSPQAELQAKGFALAFGLAALFGIVSWLLLRKQHEVLPDPGKVPAFGARTLLAPFRDRAFWPLLAFLAAFGTANGLSNPWWQPFQLQELGLSYTYVNGWFVFLTGVTMVLSLPVWGRLADRFGNRPVMALGLLLAVTHPYYYIFGTPARWWLMFGDAASSGIAWAGYNMALFNLVLAIAPRERRELYIATYAVVFGVTQAVASEVSVFAVKHLPAAMPFVLGETLGPRQQIFLITATARLACLGFFLGAVFEPRRAKPVRSFVIAAQAYVKARLESLKLLGQD